MKDFYYLQPDNFFSVGEKNYADTFSGRPPLSDSDMQKNISDTDCEGRKKGTFPWFYWPTPAGKDAFLFIYSMAHVLFSPNFCIRRQNAESFFMALTYTGTGKLTYEGKEYDCTPGNLILIDCRKPHCYRTAGSEWGYYGIYFDGRPMSVFSKILEKHQACLFFIENNTPLFLSLRQLFHINNERTPLTELENNQALTYILTEIAHMAGSKNQTPAIIREICEYLDDCYAQPVSLDLLAEKFFMNKYHLCHLFQKYMQISPLIYLNQKRIAMAKYYLVTTELPIHEIAAMVGIHSGNHFLYLFKKQESTTPSDYRKKYSLKESR